MKATALGLTAIAISASACSMAITAGADFAPDVNFGSFSSFTWDEPDTRPEGDPRLENNPFFEERLHGAIERELISRGILAGGSGPALVVHHHAAVRERVDVYEADRQAGYGNPEYGSGTQVIQYEEGTFLVDIADARTREVIWRGWAQLDIGRALDDPKVQEDEINEAISKMFENFPAPKR